MLNPKRLHISLKTEIRGYYRPFYKYLKRKIILTGACLEAVMDTSPEYRAGDPVSNLCLGSNIAP